MSIVIDFEMPKSCDVCPFMKTNDDLFSSDCRYMYCGYPHMGEYVTDCIAARHPLCPLRERKPDDGVWTSVEDRLPHDPLALCVVCVKTKSGASAPVIATYDRDGDGKWHEPIFDVVLGDVVAWIYVPPLPYEYYGMEKP